MATTLQGLATQITVLQQQISAQQARQVGLRNQLAQANSRVSALQAAVSGLRSQVSEAQSLAADIRQLQGLIGNLEPQLRNWHSRYYVAQTELRDAQEGSC